MPVLVTGGCGFLGSALVFQLVKQHGEVVVLDDLSSGSRENLPPNVRFIQGCATSREHIKEAVAGAKMIYHLASVVGQVKVCRDPAWSAEVTEVSLRRILEQAPGVPVVLFSSSAVYGLCEDGACAETMGVTEQHALDYDGGRPGYAVGKWRAEQIALERRSPSPVLIIRPFNAVGPGQTGCYGMVVPRFVERALRGDPLEIYDDGDQSRCFSASWTLTEALLRLVARWQRGLAGHSIYNLGTDAETTINQLADSVERAVGVSSGRHFLRFRDVYPGKRDIRRRLSCTRRLQGAVGPIAWPTVDQVVSEVLAGHMRVDRPELRPALAAS